MIRIGKVGDDIIYLVERNKNNPMMSKVKIGNSEKEKPVPLGSIPRFRPYDEIQLDDDINWK